MTYWKCYRICSIRRRGYYLFHREILCSFYSRVATNQERHLLNSMFSRNCKGLRKSQFYKINEELGCSLISLRFATKRYLHGTSNPFPRFRFRTMIALRASKNAELLWTACVLVPTVYTHLILPFEPEVSHAHVPLEY